MNKYLFFLACIPVALYPSGSDSAKKSKTINIYVYTLAQNKNEAEILYPPALLAHSENESEPEKPQSFLSALYELSCMHKGKIVGTTILGSYGTLLGKSITSRYWLSRAKWACWKKELSLTVLNALPQSTVVQELIHDMNQYYQACPDNSELLVVYKFLQDVEKELATLTTIQRFYRWIESTKLAKILPCNLDQHKDVEEKIARLLYLNNLVGKLYTIPLMPQEAA